jgi:AraC family transcriptional regulator of adaptative response/methylated-DNA-[protein]-cysteine methyltransferase
MLGDTARFLESALGKEYPAATRASVDAASSRLGGWVAEIVKGLEGQSTRADVPIDVQASAFRWKVWHELQKIPFGETRTYSEIAGAIGAPKSVRAVASACAKNPVSLVVPCHRVVRRTGELGGYRWGIERKRTLLDKERIALESGESKKIKAARG